MKIHIVQVDEQDDLISLQDKLAWAKSPNILLVIPASNPQLDGLDLKILNRQAEKRGARLGIQTVDPLLRLIAGELRIPVFPTRQEARLGIWGQNGSFPGIKTRPVGRRRLWELRRTLPRRQVESGPPGWLQIALFTAALAAMMALAAIFLPSARVELDPRRQIQQASLPVLLDENASVSTITGVLPLERVSLVLSGDMDTAATGQVAAADASAEGAVLVTNTSSSEVFIPAGTIMRTLASQPVRFYTLEDASLAAGHSLEMPVQAVTAGATGNVDSGQVAAVEGSLASLITVTNPEPTRGGQDRLVAAPNAADAAGLRERLLAELLQEAGSQLRETIGAGGLVLDERLAVGRIIAETYMPGIAEPGDRLVLRMEVEVVGYLVRGDDVVHLADLILDGTLPDGYQPVEGSLLTTWAGEPEFQAAGALTGSLQVERTIQAGLNDTWLAARILGRRPAAASGILAASAELNGPARIQMRPGWWPWLPLIPFKIAIVHGS